MLLMDIGPVVKAMKYPSIDLNEETHPLLWQYKNVFVQNGPRRVFIVLITAEDRLAINKIFLSVAGIPPGPCLRGKTAAGFP